jgi:hypothetical protein
MKHVPDDPSARDADARAALAAAVGGLVAVVSYAAQRWLEPQGPEAALVLATEHIPFYYRCALAAVHGLTAASAVRVALPSSHATPWLARARRLALPLVLLAAAAVAARP